MAQPDPRALYNRVAANIQTVMRGQEAGIRKLLAAFLSGGHVLLEDFPGTGKTTLAKALARSVEAHFTRIQFTPDLLPSDIVGLSIYNQRDQAFEFHRGPIFTHILLADEINRASPRTQSALLEAMAEHQVSVDGARHDLEEPFFVVATQNPVEFHGTYPLPEAQMDRFALKLSLGYVSAQDEVAVLSEQNRGHPLDALKPCASVAEVVAARAALADVRVAEEIKQYMVALVSATRKVPAVRLGASPRASLTLMKLTQALAAFDGLPFVTPDHVQEIAVEVIAHRLALDPQRRFAGESAEQVVSGILAEHARASLMARLLRAFARVYRMSQWTRRRFTPAGQGLLYLLIAAGVFGIDTRRTAAFQIFSLTGSLLLLAWLFSLRLRPTLQLERRLPEFCTVGEPFHYRQIVRNCGGQAVSGLRLRDELAGDFPGVDEFRRERHRGDSSVNWVDRRIGYPRWLELIHYRRGAAIDELPLPALAPGASCEAAIPLTPMRRGALRFQRSRLLRADPLGLVNAVADYDLPGEVVVLPRRYAVPELALPGARRFQRGGVSLSLDLGDSQEFVQLRGYRPGDPLRHIHWRSFARIGEPVVKEFQDEFLTRYALVLDTFAEGVPPEDFEAAVSVAASFVSSIHTRDALLDLMFVEDRAYRITTGRGVGQAAELLRVLAAVEPSPRADFALLTQQTLTYAPAITGCVLVLLLLDEKRRELVGRLRGLGLAPLVLVIGTDPADHTEPGVYWVDPLDIAASLARVSAA